MWSFQDLEVLSEENGDDEEYGMARNACNDVQIIYSSITFMCARSFCKNANQIYCRKVIVLHPAETATTFAVLEQLQFLCAGGIGSSTDRSVLDNATLT